MDLFSISCTTCKSRLKVREESAIGQILACPKCGGMVMVNPPAGWQKGEPLPAAPQSSSALPITTVVEVRRPDETLGDSNFDAVDDLLSDAPPKLRTPSSVSVAADAPGLARPRFMGAPPPAATPAPQKAAPQQPAPPSATPSPASAHPLPSPPVGEGPGVRGSNAADHLSPAATPTATATSASIAAETLKPPPPGEANVAEPPPPDWSPPQPWRYWAMMAGSVAAGIVLALAVVVGMIRFFKSDPQQVAQAETVPSAVTPTPASTNSSSEFATNPAASPTAIPPPGAETPAVEPLPMPPVEPMPLEPVPPEPVPPEPMPPAAPEKDPLGLTEPPQPPVKPGNPHDPLAKFDRLIGSDEAPITDETPIAPAETGAAEVEPSAAGPEKPVLPRPAPREVNITARLADPLPGIETAGTPLADFVQFMSDLTTIPITIEPDGLPLVRATVETPVVLSGPAARNTTVAAALAAGLKPLGLEFVIADDQLLVRTNEPTPLPKLSYPVKDLAADAEQMTELASELQALLEPDSWEASGGEGTLAIDAAKGTLTIAQRRAVHAQLLIAMEKLRNSRKLPLATSSAKYDPAFFRLESRRLQAEARLRTPISLNFSQPTPLVRIVDFLGKAAGVRILIDWRDIAAAGWNPDGEATLIADKQPLADALDALLQPMDLTWRVVDGRTIQVLTPETLAARAEFELYQVAGLIADDPTGAALIARTRAALGEGHFRDNGGPGELFYDDAGQCLLVSLPQPQQRELESLLTKWRGELAMK